MFVGQVEQGVQYPDNTKRKLRKGGKVEVRSLVSVWCCEELGVNIDPSLSWVYL